VNEYLVFQIYAPILSWGDIATGEARPSFDHPSKSALAGLLGAALGIRREQEQTLWRLSNDYAYASVVISAGEAFYDFHTAQVPPTRKRKNSIKTRRDELRDENALNTVLSSRMYYTDALYLACLRSITSEPLVTLESISSALNRPIFVPYFGRKSCPAGIPLNPRIYECDSAEEAFAAYAPSIPPVLSLLLKQGPYRLFWEAEDEPMQPTQSFTRRDNPMNRLRWLFYPRTEYYTMVKLPVRP